MHGLELTAPSVLIVSDGEEQLAVLQRHVQPLGVPVQVLADCTAVIECAMQVDVALILLDLQRPMLDGLEALRRLRGAPSTAHVPVIIIVERHLGLHERQRGQSQGPVCFLSRQELDFDALEEQIRLLLTLHLRANGLQMQIHAFFDDHARLAADNALMQALRPSLQRHLLLDLLTGLPNRMFFDLHLLGLMRRGARVGNSFALVWIDLDHLKRVNDRYQRAAGDQMLLAVARRLESVVRVSDVLARIEGDTFGLILDGVSQPQGAQAALAKVLAVAGEPFECVTSEGESVTLIPTLSVGVALYPRHAEDQLSLFSVAEQSAQEVLRQGGDGVQIGWNAGDGGKASHR